ncbi:hypothetical protein EVAR_43649_1 [Eumeta japonica]|uniref:Mariner Mos1 transposase n=1 Tax=Eumeta variegata TaxID=151549 RepID=A0A4C1ZLY3_EUMVA|nr:hypothetical protein EVAR_43649_1 [Eumeta japonica]
MFARFGMSGHAVTVPLENRKTVNSEWYTTTSLPGVFEEIRKNNRQHRVILHQDNASGHTSAEKLDVIGGSVTTVVRSFRRLVHGRCGWLKCVARLLNKNIISNGERSELIEEEQWKGLRGDGAGVGHRNSLTGQYTTAETNGGKRAREPPKNRWSLPPTDTHNHSGVTSPLGIDIASGVAFRSQVRCAIGKVGCRIRIEQTKHISQTGTGLASMRGKVHDDAYIGCAVSSRPTTTSPFAAGRHTSNTGCACLRIEAREPSGKRQSTTVNPLEGRSRDIDRPLTTYCTGLQSTIVCVSEYRVKLVHFRYADSDVHLKMCIYRHLVFRDQRFELTGYRAADNLRRSTLDAVWRQELISRCPDP